MAFNGSGTFTRSNGTNTGSTTWADDRDAGIKITAANHDTHDQDIASGLTNCVTKDGQTTRTADSPMSGYKHTNVDDAAARNQYASAAQVQDSELVWGGTSGGTANAQTITLSPAVTALVTGMRISFLPGNTNTGATTLNPNSVGATNIVLPNGDALVGGELSTGAPAEVLYTGTNFILLNAAPTWKAYTPTLAFITGTTIVHARYKIVGNILFGHVRFSGSTSAPDFITFTKPTDSLQSVVYGLAAVNNAGTTVENVSCFTNAANAAFRVYATNTRGAWGTGSSSADVSFFYEIA